jgi:threonine/homoserine/homoserine lactone efflux protein
VAGLGQGRLDSPCGGRAQSLETALALVGFAFVMSISPGPANFLLLASGANFGFLRSIPLVLGISFGFLTMVFFVGLGLGQVLKTTPGVYTVLKFACAAYVTWLAWKIARSRAVGPEQGETIEQPISFLQAALFQLVNPKAWAIALIVTVSYTNPEDYLPSLVLMIMVFAVINLPSISVWALSGVALRRILGDGDRIVALNIAMALLLVVSMAVVLL